MNNFIMNKISSFDKILFEKTFDQYKSMQYKIGNFN